MHQPALKISRKRIGMTGDVRFRKQWFTGRMVLQVAMVYEVTEYRYPWEINDPDRRFITVVEWEDADASAALRVSCGMTPFERKPPAFMSYATGGVVRPSGAPMWEDCGYKSARQAFNEQVYRK